MRAAGREIALSSFRRACLRAAAAGLPVQARLSVPQSRSVSVIGVGIQAMAARRVIACESIVTGVAVRENRALFLLEKALCGPPLPAFQEKEIDSYPWGGFF